MLKKKLKLADIKILQLEEKICRFKNTIESYQGQLKHLNEYKVNSTIYKNMLDIFVKSETPDDLLKEIIDTFSNDLNAGYHGFFQFNHETDRFYFKFGNAYKPGLMPGIPRVGSLMGAGFFTKEIILEKNTLSNNEYIPLNQDPPERNILCIPIYIFNEYAGTIRFANIDIKAWEDKKNIIKKAIPIICSIVEQLHTRSRNKQALQGVKAAFAITRQLENTLSEKKILRYVSTHVPKLFECKACLIILKMENGIKQLITWPEDFSFYGNKGSDSIYLRNLLESFPDGNALIKDIHKNKRWNLPRHDIKSICMAGLFCRKILRGVIIAIGKRDNVFGSTQQNFLGLVAAQTSLTLDRALYFRKQEELASFDGLTGLLNHRLFQDNIRREIERTKRYKHPLALVMFDIDHFKKFNDTYGHQLGDEILKMISSQTQKSKRTTDMAFRYGGEEFFAILPETSAENAIIFAERLRNNIERNRTVKDLSVTISLGITEYKKNDSVESFIKRADMMLYQSKNGGRNRISTG